MNDLTKASKDKIAGLFIYYDNSMDIVPGGVQICSREYFDSLTYSGFFIKKTEDRK